MFCGLGEEKRTKIRKKKRNEPHRGQKWVGWDERVSWDIQPYEIFFAVLKPFLTETIFTPNLRGGFRVLKPKSRYLLPRNLVQTYYSLILNCCPNFMLLLFCSRVISKSLFSSYKQKSEILHSLVRKWQSKNKGTCDASVGRSNKRSFFAL